MAAQPEPLRDDSVQPAVRGYLHRPASANGSGLVLTHSAGADCSAPLLCALAECFSASGYFVLRCDLPFRQRRPHGPPLGTATEDRAGLRNAVQLMRDIVRGTLFLGGHSYGERQ